MAEISAFIGSALTTIDLKGRMAIPATFRNPIIAGSGNENIVCIGFNHAAGCLTGYGTDRLASLVEQVRRREQVAIEKGEEFRSELVGGPKLDSVFQISFDGSGRLVLPKYLISVAKIQKHIFLSGNAIDFSIWAPEHLLSLDDPRLAPQQFNARFRLEEQGISI